MYAYMEVRVFTQSNRTHVKKYMWSHCSVCVCVCVRDVYVNLYILIYMYGGCEVCAWMWCCTFCARNILFGTSQRRVDTMSTSCYRFHAVTSNACDDDNIIVAFAFSSHNSSIGSFMYLLLTTKCIFCLAAREREIAVKDKWTQCIFSIWRNR